MTRTDRRVMADPTLTDCSCGAPRVLDVDGESAAEVCVRCGLEQRIEPDFRGIREAVRESRRRRLLGPSCTYRRHHLCTAQLCQCTCHPDQRPRRPA